MKIAQYLKGPRGVQKQAIVFSAFAKAFGKSLIAGTPDFGVEPVPGCIRFWAKEVHLYLEPDIRLQIEDLFGNLIVRDPGRPFAPEAKGDYDLRVEGGKIFLDAESLSHLLNRYLLPGTMIEKISIAFEGQTMKAEARINFSHVNLPISLESEISLSPEGRIALRTKKLSSPNFLLSGLLRFFPVEIARVLKLPEGAPLSVHGDTLFVDAEGIIPCPKVFGCLKAVELENGQLGLTYAGKVPKPPLLEPAPHYLMCVGHEVEIGKILLRDARLQVIQADPEKKHLDFSLESYHRQLIEGIARLRPDEALLVSIPNLRE
ncbi:MAG TPA: hypothetical protein V6C82_06865 [Chroococcales cyanobacterium]